MLKNYLIALLILIVAFPFFGKGQILDLGECRPDGLSKTGLGQLKEKIGNARILIIGEQEHGVGTEYESFAFLVKWLHEELGFNVIAQEFCFYSFGKINANLQQVSAQEYRTSMYWPQGKAREYDLLFDYIDAQQRTENQLYMEGFDSRFFLRKDFYNHIDTLLSTHPNKLLPQKHVDSYLTILDRALKTEYKDTTIRTDQKFFLKKTEVVIRKMNQYDYPPRQIQQLKSLIGFVKNAWNVGNYESSAVQRFHEREKQMAANLIWLIEEAYPNEKIIVRMHNGHAAKNIQMLEGILPDSLIKNALTVGQLLNERYGNSCHFIGTTAYAGTYCKWDYQPKTIPVPHPESLEHYLHTKGYKYAYFDCSINRDSTFSMFFNDFNTWYEAEQIKAPFGQLFDGMLFIDSVKQPTEIVKQD